MLILICGEMMCCSKLCICGRILKRQTKRYIHKEKLGDIAIADVADEVFPCLILFKYFIDYNEISLRNDLILTLYYTLHCTVFTIKN
jgi:hypothetical protein